MWCNSEDFFLITLQLLLRRCHILEWFEFVSREVCLRLFVCSLQVIKYESVIHEFDPYFNYRVTQVCLHHFLSPFGKLQVSFTPEKMLNFIVNDQWLSMSVPLYLKYLIMVVFSLAKQRNNLVLKLLYVKNATNECL